MKKILFLISFLVSTLLLPAQTIQEICDTHTVISYGYDEGDYYILTEYDGVFDYRAFYFKPTMAMSYLSIFILHTEKILYQVNSPFLLFIKSLELTWSLEQNGVQISIIVDEDYTYIEILNKNTE